MDRGTAATEQAARQAEQSYSATAEGISDFNSKLLAIAQTNMMAWMNFVSELTHAKGPTEAMELWSRHAQYGFQRWTEQSQELVTLCQKTSGVKRRTIDTRRGWNIQTRTVKPKAVGPSP